MFNNQVGRCLSWYRWEHRDPYNKKYYTAITCSVMGPCIEKPYVSVLVSVANATGKVTFRCRDVDEALIIINLPDEVVLRLKEAVVKGNAMADEIERAYKLMFELRKVGPEKSDDYMKEVERILKEKGRE